MELKIESQLKETIKMEPENKDQPLPQDQDEELEGDEYLDMTWEELTAGALAELLKNQKRESLQQEQNLQNQEKWDLFRKLYESS
jgi:hypothetical protein